MTETDEDIEYINAIADEASEIIRTMTSRVLAENSLASDLELSTVLLSSVIDTTCSNGGVIREPGFESIMAAVFGTIAHLRARGVIEYAKKANVAH